MQNSLHILVQIVRLLRHILFIVSLTLQKFCVLSESNEWFIEELAFSSRLNCFI
jgi:hypothetical protein